MKNAASVEKLPSTGTDIASRVKNLFSGSPISKRKRTLSLDTLTNNQDLPSSPASPTLGVTLSELVKRDGQPIPFIITKIVQYIEEFGMEQIGIYRINGNVRCIEKLRAAFDKDGDANFEDEDIASVAGLLKLFLRELPDGVIPEILMTHFVDVQQSYPGEATPDALAALKHCLEFLPEANFNVLKYLIRHMAKVSEYSDKNKMTAVSLSIVFGPNLFHCGSGLEALKLQGYSNSSVCRMVQYHKVLFPSSRGRKRAGSDLPARPVPYVEHVAKKKKENDLLSPDSEDHIVSSESHDQSHDLSHDLSHDQDVSHSERSIDEAILERSHGTISPASPAHLPNDELPRDPPTSKPLPSHSPGVNEGEVALGDENDAEEGSGFHRRYAKRGMTFRPRTEGTPTNSSRVVFNRTLSDGDMLSAGPTTPHHVPTSISASGGLRDTNRTPSPYSPGPSPPTSPAITPRTASLMNSVIGATIREFLFRPPQLRDSDKKSDSTKGPKQTVYGLLLPNMNTTTNNKDRTLQNHKSTSSTSVTDLPSTTETTLTKLTDLDSSCTEVVRRKKNPRNQRNRISALHGSELTFSSTDASFTMETTDGPSDTKLSSKRSNESGLTKQGSDPRSSKVLDLVKQFDEEPGPGPGLGSPKEARRGSDGSGAGKRRSQPKALEMFEKSGVMIGMGRSPRMSSKTSTSTSGRALSNEVKGQRLSLVLSVSDEEVFDGPPQDLTAIPKLPSDSGRRRQPLSTNTSDDVFFSPVHTSHEVGKDKPYTERKRSSVSEELDLIQPTAALQHLTLSRPKGPASRRKPRRFTVPEVNTRSNSNQHLINDTTDHTHQTHPPSSKDSTPSGSPSIKNKILNVVEQRKSSQPLDLTALAPEQKQAVSSVKKGWSEGEKTKEKGEQRRMESGPTLKEVSRKIHDLKKSVREFETSFAEQHHRKPSNHERSPIRSRLIELSKLKRTFKELREEERLSKTAPAEVHNKQIKGSSSGTTTRLLKITEASTTDDLSPRRHMSLPSSTATGGGVAGGGATKPAGGCVVKPAKVSPLEDILNKIMSSLETRRRACSRPNNLEQMDEAQIQDEKHAIQKLLLNFEKHHGRPQSHVDKETMRPLYDRYRAVKRICSTSGGGGGGRERENSSASAYPRVSAAGLDSTADTLPSVTLLQSYSNTDGFPDLSKSGEALLSTDAPAEKSRRTERRGSDGRIRRKISAGSKRDTKQMWTEEELQTASLVELREQSLLLLDEKAGLRKTLKEFENSFVAKHGRAVTRGDRKPMEKEYNLYKTVKARLKTVETLITKKDPLKTI